MSPNVSHEDLFTSRAVTPPLTLSNSSVVSSRRDATSVSFVVCFSFIESLLSWVLSAAAATSQAHNCRCRFSRHTLNSNDAGALLRREQARVADEIIMRGARETYRPASC